MTVQLIPHRVDKIIGLEINGRVEARDIVRVTELIEQKLKQEQKLRIYAQISSWSGMSLAAFIKDLKFSLGHLQDFEKEAIVSDQPWLKALASVSNSLFSSIEVKHFTLEEKEQALAWIAD